MTLRNVSKSLAKAHNLVLSLIKIRGLAATLTLAFLIVSTTAVIISSSINIYSNFLSNQEVVAKQQQVVANEAVEEVKCFIQEIIVTLTSVGNVNNNLIDNSEMQKNIMGKLLGLNSAFRQVALTDAQNVELSRVSRLSNSAEGQLTDANKEEAFHQMDSSQHYISPVYVDDITFEPIIIIAVPIKNNIGDKTGTILAELNLKFMWDLIDSMSIGKKGLAYVVDRNGDLIAFSDETRVIKGENLLKLKKVSEFANNSNVPNNEHKADVSKGILGYDSVTSFVPLIQPDWAIVIEVPVSEAYEPIIKSLVVSLLVMLFSFTFAIIAGIYLSKRITKPIVNLRNATKIISKGDLNAKIDIVSKNEIGELAANFNQMVVNISSLIANAKQAANVILEQSLLLKEGASQSAQTAEAVVLAMEQISQGTEEQAHEAQTTTGKTNTLGVEIDNVVLKASEVEKITESTKDLSIKSKDTVQLLIKKAKETDRITRIFSEDTSNLNRSIEKIRSITNAIATITKKTKLLSLNARIEAAKAGDAGLGFTVIASEISKLAVQSQESAKMIDPILKEILLNTENSTKTSEQAHQIVEDQMQAVYSAQNAFDEVVSAMDDIIQRIIEMSTIIKKIDSFKEETISSVMTISTISQETAASSEEISASSEEQKAIADQVKDFADNLYKMGVKLADAINIFKIN